MSSSQVSRVRRNGSPPPQPGRKHQPLRATVPFQLLGATATRGPAPASSPAPAAAAQGCPHNNGGAAAAVAAAASAASSAVATTPATVASAVVVAAAASSHAAQTAPSSGLGPGHGGAAQAGDAGSGPPAAAGATKQAASPERRSPASPGCKAAAAAGGERQRVARTSSSSPSVGGPARRATAGGGGGCPAPLDAIAGVYLTGQWPRDHHHHPHPAAPAVRDKATQVRAAQRRGSPPGRGNPARRRHGARNGRGVIAKLRQQLQRSKQSGLEREAVSPLLAGLTGLTGLTGAATAADRRRPAAGGGGWMHLRASQVAGAQLARSILTSQRPSRPTPGDASALSSHGRCRVRTPQVAMPKPMAIALAGFPSMPGGSGGGAAPAPTLGKGVLPRLRASVEALNQEIERVFVQEAWCHDSPRQDAPDGRRAPLPTRPCSSNSGIGGSSSGSSGGSGNNAATRSVDTQTPSALDGERCRSLPASPALLPPLPPAAATAAALHHHNHHHQQQQQHYSNHLAGRSPPPPPPPPVHGAAALTVKQQQQQQLAPVVMSSTSSSTLTALATVDYVNREGGGGGGGGPEGRGGSPLPKYVSSPKPNHSYTFMREPPEGCERVTAFEETQQHKDIPSIFCPDKNKVNFVIKSDTAFCPISLLRPPPRILRFTPEPAQGSAQDAGQGSAGDAPEEMESPSCILRQHSTDR
ncbi:glucocorticoid-induced transcript 1 protein-like [Lethenteron reissneri]|uniref:glucocorticoid-induced transcript 1 protein-like n=1 Tax=Lethenteron reissneri TaxID=7753 RepID=UPI002AB7C2C1|nr:glucocorticoid-induced transcript 1 protein-like [Lethenteron reissneri]